MGALPQHVNAAGGGPRLCVESGCANSSAWRTTRGGQRHSLAHHAHALTLPPCGASPDSERTCCTRRDTVSCRAAANQIEWQLELEGEEAQPTREQMKEVDGEKEEDAVRKWAALKFPGRAIKSVTHLTHGQVRGERLHQRPGGTAWGGSGRGEAVGALPQHVHAAGGGPRLCVESGCANSSAWRTTRGGQRHSLAHHAHALTLPPCRPGH